MSGQTGCQGAPLIDSASQAGAEVMLHAKPTAQLTDGRTSEQAEKYKLKKYGRHLGAASHSQVDVGCPRLPLQTRGHCAHEGHARILHLQAAVP